jgi:hypothetical protein
MVRAAKMGVALVQSPLDAVLALFERHAPARRQIAMASDKYLP